MNAEGLKLVVDTNVWVDSYCSEHPGNETAIRQLAWGCMRNMNEVATPIGADVSDIWLADKYLKIHPDFEDNLVLAACRRVKADFLVTNDAQLIAHADVVAKTPEQMLQLLLLD